MEKPDLIIIQQPGDAQVAELRNRLSGYNISMIGDFAMPSFLVTHRSDKHELLGGVYAFIRFQWLVIDLVWVVEAHRGRGLGAQLLQKAEEIALSYGVNRFRLNTASFQKGLSLYQKQGYEIFAELPSANMVDGKPVAFTDYYLKKEVG